MSSKIERMTQSPNLSESQSPSASAKAADTHSTGIEADVSHFDTIDAMDDAAPLGEGGDASTAAGLISKDDFFAAFRMMFALPNMVPVPPFPLTSLPIGESELEPARAASDAIYDIAAESAYLRWLVEPGSLWMQRTLTIGSFAALKLMAVRAEIAARPKHDAKPAQPANDDKSDGSDASGVTVIPE